MNECFIFKLFIGVNFSVTVQTPLADIYIFVFLLDFILRLIVLFKNFYFKEINRKS